LREEVKSFLGKSVWIAAIVFIVLYSILSPETIYDFFGIIGEVVTCTIGFMTLYEKIFWRLNKLEKIPKLHKKYHGEIVYTYNGSNQKKNVVLIIKQSLLTVIVKIKTDEITSTSVSSNLVLENDEYILYYTYITNPKSKYSMDNPIQHGTCRLVIDNVDKIDGSYWTSRKTIGDIQVKSN